MGCCLLCLLSNQEVAKCTTICKQQPYLHTRPDSQGTQCSAANYLGKCMGELSDTET